ncbi:restriction endonuclease subunit S [Aeromonas veronii]|uniref:Type I restriction modification DNA specificity domain-containing protein n=1 Tax=Aeromonas veronii AMC34 TaxID=1073383 RepID=K1IL02_AERVE|nr:restriction endonuclease subunit S [Aeromonas veronii]EKB18876.1 hypothetical protein HMPREF1168_02650 [Aeromonas veronii AMC34]
MSDAVATSQQGLAGKYKPYPEYKDSGVEWLGEVPIDWGASRHKYIATFAKGKNPKELFDEVGIGRHQYLAMGFLRGLEVPKYCDLDSSTILVMENQILIIWDGSNAGEFVKATHGVLSSTMAAVTTNSNIHDGFYWYYCKSIEPEMRRHANGMGIPHVDGDELKAIVIPQPALEEQRSIAAFLDYETARIDRLITQQQRLIELLKEKRQALISHAVTKGLNPNAPMKDSGVEWLGQVPEHWEVTRSKFVSEIFVPQRNKPELNDIGDGIFWATMEDMKNDEINETRRFVSSDAATISGSKVLQKGAVVASCVGNFGVAALLNVDVIINQQLQAYIPKTISGQYLRDLISISKTYFELVGTAATLIYVNQEGFGNMPVTRPPIEEQLEIEKYNNKIKEKFEHAIAKGELQVSLLQERRTALISAAVTGKIDLRGWTPPAEEVAA